MLGNIHLGSALPLLYNLKLFLTCSPAAASKLIKDSFVAHSWGLLGALNLYNTGTQDKDLVFMESNQGPKLGFIVTSFTYFIANHKLKIFLISTLISLIPRWIQTIQLLLDKGIKITLLVLKLK